MSTTFLCSQHAKQWWSKVAHCDVFPARVIVESAVNVVLQGNGEPVHEGCAWCDCVAVKHIRLVFHWDFDTLLSKLLTQLLFLFLLQHRCSGLLHVMCVLCAWQAGRHFVHKAQVAGALSSEVLPVHALHGERSNKSRRAKYITQYAAAELQEGLAFSSASWAARKRLERC